MSTIRLRERWFWVAALVVMWNLLFDWQVWRAGERFVADQLVRREQAAQYARLGDVMSPAVRQAALLSTLPVTLAAGGALLRRRRR
jgi:hypothetical protein